MSRDCGVRISTIQSENLHEVSRDCCVVYISTIQSENLQDVSRDCCVVYISTIQSENLHEVSRDCCVVYISTIQSENLHEVSRDYPPWPPHQHTWPPFGVKTCKRAQIVERTLWFAWVKFLQHLN